MPKIKITFPDKKKKQYEKGISAKDIAFSIGEGLGRASLAAVINGKLVDLSTKINKDSEIKFITFKDEIGKEIFRHSSAHIMADAVMELFPDAKPTIGPAIGDGFYYDFHVKKPFKPEDLEKIEKKMKEIIKKDIPFEMIELKVCDANEHFKDNKYKKELLSEFEEDPIIYKHGEFIDLCKGPHVPSTGYIKTFKLTKISGAYWRGDSEKDQLQRIYGVSFPDKKQLKAHLKLIEEAEKRDHRKLGKEMNLFSFHEESPGCVFFHSKGVQLYYNLISLWQKEHKKAGYTEIRTPLILKKSLWVTSGHWDNYRENMYLTKIDGEDYAVKPMNCPGSMLVYKEKSHSYKEFPLRVGELGVVHRHELSGVLNGLFRIRMFAQDDAHIFMTKDQIRSEIISLMNLYDKIYKLFGFEYNIELSTRPEKSVGDDKMWEFSEKELEEALKQAGKVYVINKGDGAFYGPKIDFHLKDAIGRTWQCGTIQLDMSLPERFDLEYFDKDGTKKRPVMIHRVVYGSIERFLGLLIEHYAGKFPVWLVPVQVRILTVADRFEKYAKKVEQELLKDGIRVEVDARTESVQYKVREAQLQKIPIIVNVGEKEEKAKTLAIRTLDGNVKFGVKTKDLIKKVKKAVEEKVEEFKV